MTKRILTFLTLLALPICMMAQTQVSGKITDAESGEPLIGANILVQGTNGGTNTDLDGNYQLSIDSDAVLEISYTGYADQTVSVSNSGGAITQDITLTTDALQLESVTVTANKKAESIQDVPASITALTPTELRRMGAFEATDYFSSVPNLSLAATGGNTGSGFGDGHSGRNIAIRGISGTNTTAMYLDETPLAEFVDPRLFDIARVEVLRGPQGTLYGSSTMGGAVKVITNQPNVAQTEGSFEIGAGTVKEGDLDYNVQGVYNVPFSDKAALRIGGFYDAKSGVFDRVKQTHYGTNADGAGGLPINSPWTTNGIALSPIPGTTGAALEQTEAIKENVDDRTTYGLNVSLGLYPSEKVSIVPKFIYQNHSQDGWEFADFRAGNFIQNRVAGIDETYDNEWWQASLSMDFDIGLGKLISSTSYTKLDQQDTEDTSERQTLGPDPGSGGDFPDGLYAPEFIQRTGAYNRFVQELRLTSNTKTKFDYTVGLFYSNENNNADALQQRDGYFNFWSNVLADIVPEVSLFTGYRY